MRRLGFALAAMGMAVTALGLVACSGDDTDTPLPVSDAGPGDATLGGDGGTGDASSHADAPSSDGGTELDGSAACVQVDAAAFTDAEVQAGLAIVLARKCEGCHGEQLQGNSNGLPSTNADGGMAYPPDLTPDPVNGLGCWTNDEIARAFLHGIDKAGDPLCNPMPQFGEPGASGGEIDDAGAAAVVAYLRSIPVVVNAKVPKTPACFPPVVVDGGADAGTDAGHHDAGTDASVDAAADAAADAGADAGADAAADAGADAEAEDAAADDGG
jgi:hypothetical protein